MPPQGFPQEMGPYGMPDPSQGYPQMAPYVSPYEYANPREKNTLNVVSLVLGICSIAVCLAFVSGIPAIIVGVLGLRAAGQGRATNKGVGLAGIITGAIGTVVATLVWVWLLSG